MSSLPADDKQSVSTYLRWLGGAITVAVAAVGLFNFLVDPHDIYRLCAIPGLNANKTMAATDIRLQKAYAVAFLRPRTVILGTSREEGALSPQHPGFTHRPVYNLAIPAATPYEMLRYLRHSQAVQPLRLAIVALEFSSFHLVTASSTGNFQESRLSGISGPIPPLVRLYQTDLLPTLFSLPTTKLSIATLKTQDAGVECRPDGMRDWEVLLHGQIDRVGVRASFLDAEEGLAKLMRRYLQTRPGLDDPHLSYQSFQDMLGFCHQHNIPLMIMLAPVHARWLTALTLAGLDEELRAWEKRLVAINEAQAENYQKRPFPFWDFSLPTTFTTESLPPADTSGELRWFWESSHYKQALGDVILDRMLTATGQTAGVTDGFGLRLSPSTIDAVLQRGQADMAEYLGGHPEDREEVRRIVTKVFADTPTPPGSPFPREP